MFNEYLFHLCDCTCLNVMGVCSTICGSNQKDFCSFCLFLEVICITHVFQTFSSYFCVKNMFCGCFCTYFMCKFSHEFKGSIIMFFNFGQRVLRFSRNCFTSKAYQRNTSKIPAKFFRENFQINF